MTYSINKNTNELINELVNDHKRLNLKITEGPLGCTIIDAGIEILGSIEAGIKISEICLGGLGKVRILPNGYRRLAIGPRNYYYYYGTYYIKTGDEYQVAEAPIGAEVTSLPEGYNTVNINNQEYYELDGNYYMPSIDENNEEILVLVNNPNK